MTKIMNADALEKTLKEKISQTVETVKESTGMKRQPKVVIITATDDKSSHRYVANKLKTAKELGIDAEKMEFDSTVTGEELEKTIEDLNTNSEVDGIILQLPIYDYLNAEVLLNTIDFDKDVDGLTLMSKAFLESNDINYMPCTPAGVIYMLASYGINHKWLAGKNVVVVGRGETSGAPMSVAFRHLDANVTTLHSKTNKEDLEFYIRHADVIISCVGKRHLIKADWFKKDSIAIGVGFEYDENGKQHLDFEVDKVAELGKAAYVSQRTNCTGKATVLSLMFNTTLAYCRQAFGDN